MLAISMVASLALWIALPWALLGWTPTLVTSGSMAPLVSPGDVVMIRPVSSADLGPDTVVLYDRSESGRILHRIVAALPDGTFRTRGDANADVDSAPVAVADVRGAAVLAVPWIGQPSLWLHDGRALPLAAAGIVLLVLLALAPRAFDPAFDPWVAAQRVNPAELLLDRAGAHPGDRRADSSRLLPENLHNLVHERLAGQSGVAAARTIQLLEGLS